MAVDLGFVEKCESWRLESRFFPSKVGGKPAWLNLKDIPGKADLQCEYCNDPCIFLCQIYAPYEEDNDAFHRTIYIFICKNVECCKPNQNGNLKVFRSQLNRINIFYPSEPPVEEKDWRTDIDVSQWTKTCHTCGTLAPNHCARCKAINYCSKIHQVYDWKNGHKNKCNINANSSNDIHVYSSSLDQEDKKLECRSASSICNNSNNFLLPEYEIVIENDDNTKENEQDDFEKDQREIEKFNMMVKDDKAGTLQYENVNNDLLHMANDEKDEMFAKFRKKIDNFPDQILRYNRGGEILYISLYNQVTDIPKCSECNGERQFEFQIMPQLLNFLNLKDVESLDWGILAVFTCKRSCMPNSKYVKEYIWKQDIQELN